MTLVPHDKVDSVEVFLAEEGAVEENERTMTLSELVILVGRRVTITYRVDGQRRLADSIIVEPD